MTIGPIEYDFMPWTILNEEGHIVGIKDDAPVEAKKAYEEFMRDEYGEDGILIA